MFCFQKIALQKLFILPLAFVISCGSDEEVIYDEKQDDFINQVDYDEFSQELLDLEKEILANPGNEELLKESTTKFQDFAGYFPQDPKAPDYLKKASDNALLLGQIEKSIKILDRIIAEYPEYSKIDEVMFDKASHLDFNLRDTTAAKIAYQEFIDKFPNAPEVPDAKNRIENISLTLDELADKFIQDLEKKSN